MRTGRISFGVVAIVALLGFGAREAQAEENGRSSPAFLANVGLQTGLGPVLIVPSNGGPIGGGLDLDVRYGIEAGPVLVAPGGRLSGYFISGRFIGLVMPTARVTLPVGPFAPYVLGGVGGGWLSNPADSGVALLGGGGLMIHFGSVLALGAEISYQAVTNTGFGILAFGPMISLGL